MKLRYLTVALAVAAAGLTSCANPPKPVAPIRVTTEATTFDGVCDETDCSLLDAIHKSNTTPNPNNLPNEIRIPPGTYKLVGETPVEITRSVIINGQGRSMTTLDLTDSPIAAPAAAIDPKFPTVITGMRIQSTTETPTHVLASCAGHLPKSISLLNSAVHGLAAASTACDAVFLGTDVIGPATVIQPNSISATGSRLPFPDEPLVLWRFSFLNSVITGPSSGDGESIDSTLTLHPPAGANINGTFTGTHFQRVGLSVGDPDGGNVFASAIASSFDLAGDDGPRQLEVTPGSNLRLNQSTVFGGGPGGAILADGSLVLQGATLANDGPAIVVGDGATVTARRSILSTYGSVVCTAPITLTARNLLVGSTCGTPSPSDITVADHAALGLEAVTGMGSRTPTYSMAPEPTSPAVDSVPIEWTGGLDCPFNTVQNMGTSMDNRGFARPSGVACDRGAVEYQYPVEPTTPPVDPEPGDPEPPVDPEPGHGEGGGETP